MRDTRIPYDRQERRVRQTHPLRACTTARRVEQRIVLAKVLRRMVDVEVEPRGYGGRIGRRLRGLAQIERDTRRADVGQVQNRVGGDATTGTLRRRRDRDRRLEPIQREAKKLV